MFLFRNIISLIEHSGFYFVPILCIMALFNLRELRQWRGRCCYLILCALCLGAHLIFGGSARYLFLGLLPCTLLAGAGSVMLVKYLHFIKHLQWLKPRHLMLLLTICTIAVCFLRISTRKHDMEVKELSELFLSIEDPIVICSAECSHGMKLAGLLRHKSNIATQLFDNWDSAMDFLTINQYGNREIFFFTRIKKPHTPEEFINFFRGKYSIWPFDIIAYNDGFLITKFNGKTLDGAIQHPRVQLLDNLPEVLPAEKYRNWAKIDLAEYHLAPPGFLISNSGPTDSRYAYLRLEQQQHIPSATRLALYNELCWRETFRDFAITDSPQTAETPSAVQTSSGEAVALPAKLNDNAPLLLDPSPYFTTRKIESANYHNLAVLWHPGSDRFGVSENILSNDMRNFTIKDIYLDQSSHFDLKTCYQELTTLQNRQLKILLFEEKSSKNLNISTELPKLLAPGSTLEICQIPYAFESSLDSLHKLRLPTGKYDLILVNIFADAFARPSTVPLQADPKITQSMDKIVAKLQKTYPETLIVFIMPPPPTGGFSMYPLANSPQISRLAHYHICGAVERWYRQKQPAQAELVKLYLTLNPKEDYLRYSQSNPVWMGYSFTAGGQKRIAEDIGAFLAYKIQHKEL